MVSHWSDYSVSIATAHDVQIPEDYEIYMGANGVLVDEPEVVACARCYEICILILSGPSFTTHQRSAICSDNSQKKVLKLHLRSQHYRLINDNADERDPPTKSAHSREKQVVRSASSRNSDSEIEMPPPMMKLPTIEISPAPIVQSSRSRSIKRPSRFLL
jgi:hypothetical protein